MTVTSSSVVWVCLILTATTGLVADVVAKRGHFWLSFLIHVPNCFFWLIALTKGPQLSSIGVSYGIIAGIGAVIVGHLFLGDHITLTQWIGVGLGLMAISLL